MFLTMPAKRRRLNDLDDHNEHEARTGTDAIQHATKRRCTVNTCGRDIISTLSDYLAYPNTHVYG